ncbi:hypothetical protein CVD28_04595 [Bacillus sp. M6-12]|uniref:hypothetical protein n=1 Tax=Bacillus sp. M6-12 TaxID=2054166 RepID=UPI000C760B7B|nr:hypothetical protein [Bacillus sp. M6-12]PLS19696.1 hypothetical protein CVD28_04595 [Bacillus sp. M6-12]
MEKQEKNQVEIENKEQPEKLSFDKMYFFDLNKMTKTMGKTTLLVILGVVLFNFMFSDIQWWAKALVGLGSFLLVAFVYYDVKYMLGMKKNPFQIFPERKIFRYYNEFEGNKEIDITKIKEIKVYSRPKPEEIFLLEIFLHNKKKEENVNVAGFTQNTIHELMNDIRQFNSDYIITTNRDPKNKEKK